MDEDQLGMEQQQLEYKLDEERIMQEDELKRTEAQIRELTLKQQEIEEQERMLLE